MVSYAHRSALWIRSAFLMTLATPLWGCNPIDQRTFDPQAGRPPRVAAPALPVSAPGKPAFLQIIDGTPEDEYGPAVEKATKLALSRKANILFIVQGITPMQQTPEAERQTLHDITQHLVSSVGHHILAAGARPIQLDMRVSADPTVHNNMVRIYVR